MPPLGGQRQNQEIGRTSTGGGEGEPQAPGDTGETLGRVHAERFDRGSITLL